MRSNLLSSLLQNIDEGRLLTVLDVGSALPETVNFFSQYRCRLFFTDIFSDEILNRNNDEISDEELRNHFVALLDYPAQTKFDICLFWDVLNYLDERALRTFSEVLKPYLASSSGVHGFSALKASTALPSQQYAIMQIDRLKLRHRESIPLPGFVHPQIELNKILHGMKVGKATLLSGGLLEILFSVAESPA